MKQCTKCKEIKSENKFSIKKRHKDGLSYWCKDCRRKFTELDTLPKMKTPINEIGSALNMYYGGMPIAITQGNSIGDLAGEYRAYAVSWGHGCLHHGE